MARSQIGGAYNIPASIIREAEKLGLKAMATGGNVDYIFKQVGTNEDGSPRLVILGDALDAGSPDRLNDKSELHIMLSEDWTEQISIPFKTALEGLRVMSTMYDPMRVEE